MFLHQNDTFHSAIIGGAALYPGVHTFAQLNAALPAYFPSTWTAQNGSTVTAGSGSITVSAPPPGVLLSTFSGSTLQLQWDPGILLEATNIFGPWTTNNNVSPYTFTPTGPQKFFRVQLQ
jgi:hypothetical protein